MAKIKHNKSAKPSIFAGFAKRLKRLFNAKNIVVISEHAVGHYAISIRQQCGIAFALLGTVALISYSIGRYIQASDEIAQQEHVIENAEAENEKIHNDFVLLKRDLIKMGEDGATDGNMSDYAQFVLEQYQNVNIADNAVAGQSNPLLERVNFLETQLQQSELQRTEFMNEVYLLTKSKARALHKALGITGMNDKMSRILDYRMQKMLAKDGNNAGNNNAGQGNQGQGGAYQPLNNSLSNDDISNAKLTEQQTLNEVIYLNELVGLIDELPTRIPVDRAKRTSGFGGRIDPFRRTLANHTGIDFSAPIGAKIKATAAGRVRLAGHIGAYGKTIEIDHGNSIASRYSHLSKINVAVGQKIQAGDVIGLQGTTGRSTGHHLHYEVRHHNIPINPDKFLTAGNYVSKIFK